MPSTKQPIARISPPDLDSLMKTLEVDVVALSECLVSPGYSLDMGGNKAPGIHYNLKGTGKVLIGNTAPIELAPHTMIVVPANCPFRIVTASAPGGRSPMRMVDGRSQTATTGVIRRFVAGGDNPEVLMICGFFNASYGATTDLFGALSAPIVEQFGETEGLDHKLRSALAELVAQEVGSGAMSSALLKQVIVALLRRSLNSINLWVERFAMLSDPQIARAFSEMAAHPGGNHTVMSLADSAHLSRSAFMARFTGLIGQSPMAVLRDLRMRQAARQLESGSLSIDQISHAAGYESRSSFIRAFQKSYSCDPTDFRDNAKAGGTKLREVK